MKAKTLLALLLACLLSLTLAVSAFADAGGPYFSSLQAVVSAEDGVMLYDYKNNAIRTIPKGEKLTLTGEYDEGNKTRYYTSFEDDYGYVTKDGLLLDLTPVSTDGFEQFVPAEHYSVFAAAGVVMRTGPDSAYDAVMTVPKGAEIVCTHNNVPANEFAGDPAWAYGSYQGKTGWVEINGNENTPALVNLVQPDGRLDGTLTLLEATRLRAEPWSSESIGAEIPAGTALQYTRYYSSLALVEYQGVEGWLPLYENAIAGERGLVFVSSPYGVPVYETVGDTGSETDRVLPFGSLLEVSAHGTKNVEAQADSYRGDEDWSWFRVSVDGKPCWIAFSGWNGYSYSSQDSYLKVMASDGLTLRAMPATDADVSGTIKAGAAVTEKFSYYDEDAETNWFYVTDGSTSGWMIYDEKAVAHITPTQYAAMTAPAETTAAATEAPTDAATTGAAATDAASMQPLDGDGMTAKTPPRTIILGSVAAAVVLALVAAVTILLIKKKKSAEE